MPLPVKDYLIILEFLSFGFNVNFVTNLLQSFYREKWKYGTVVLRFIDYYQDEDGIFTAVAPALPGCVASGKTLEEAYQHIKEAIESCLEVRKKLEMPIGGNKYTS